MSASRPMPPGSVPTLTEIVQWPAEASRDVARTATAMPAAPAMAPVTPSRPDAAPVAPLPTEDELAKRVVADLQRHIDLMLDVRLKEALAPILARATDALVRDVRNQLASTLRDVVTRAVAKEMSRPPRK